ncbi:hypothetical protein ACZ11_23365 [Lysinibacillus xylanilyticus]|uniref:Uncharacterized protein n=1 Tax=Lysinibacillus xylanilyticus TaxID=582475 RepID=A0A0K9F0T4_9BACI|nr:hypothetical protein ACZ11_23365 [Lysinibacillus xylanilyticus]
MVSPAFKSTSPANVTVPLPRTARKVNTAITFTFNNGNSPLIKFVVAFWRIANDGLIPAPKLIVTAAVVE